MKIREAGKLLLRALNCSVVRGNFTCTTPEIHDPADDDDKVTNLLNSIAGYGFPLLSRPPSILRATKLRMAGA